MSRSSLSLSLQVVVLALVLGTGCAGTPSKPFEISFEAGEDPITKALLDLQAQPRPGKLEAAEDGTPLLKLETNDGSILFMVEPQTPERAACAPMKRPETVEWWFFEAPNPLLLQLTAEAIRFYRYDPAQRCIVSWPAWEAPNIDGDVLLELSLSYEEGQEMAMQELVEGRDVFPYPGQERIRLSFGLLEISGEDGTKLLSQPMLADDDYCSSVSVVFMRNSLGLHTLRASTSDGNACMFEDEERELGSTVEFVWSDLEDRLEPQLQQTEQSLVAKTWSGVQRARSVSFKQSYPGLFGRVDNYSSRDIATWEWQEEMDQKQGCVNEQGVESITVKTCSTSGNNTAQAVAWTFSDFQGQSWDLARFEWQQPINEKVECRTICGY